MSAQKLWLEYRPDRITFQNGNTIKFPASARMLYEPEDHIIALEMTAAQRAAIKQRIPVRPDSAPSFELKRIEYSMLFDFDGHRATYRFFHPMKKGNAVRLRINDRGELFFLNDAERPLFSKNYTVRDVTRGEIDSDRAVWQFHGYRHEH